jgi:hypothetical protein
MAQRFCTQCGTDVEDAGGFCLLGHSLRVSGPVDNSIAALRAEVEEAFEEARVLVSTALSADPSGPPPPPPPPMTRVAVIEDQPMSGADPIADFAPAPRMDWGPERHGLLKRLS